MTYVDTSQRDEYTSATTQTVFAYTFRILADSDLVVYNEGTLQTLTTHYTVSGAGSAGGGNVTFVTAPGFQKTIIILRAEPNTQNTDYTPGGQFPAETHETALDKLTMQVQDLQEIVARATKMPITSLLRDIDFPASAARGSKLIRWVAAGDELEEVTAETIAGQGTSITTDIYRFIADPTQADQGVSTTNSIKAHIDTIAGVDETILLPPGTYNFSTSETVPANVTLMIQSGAVINVANSVTVTIDGRIEAGEYQVFSGDGNVTAGSQDYFLVKWYGATGDGSTNDTAAIQKCIDSVYNTAVAADHANSYSRYTPVLFSPGQYMITRIKSYNHVRLIGVGAGTAHSSSVGQYQTELKQIDNTNQDLILFETGDSNSFVHDVSVENMSLRGSWTGIGDTGTTSGSAILFNGVTPGQNVRIVKLNIHNFAADAIKLTRNALPGTFRDIWGRFINGAVIRVNTVAARGTHMFMADNIQGDYCVNGVIYIDNDGLGQNALANTYLFSNIKYELNRVGASRYSRDAITFNDFDRATVTVLNCNLLPGPTEATDTVSSITRSGTDATVTISTDHGLVQGDKITIAGADQTEYNVTGVITSVPTSATFVYTVSGSPATPATGTITSNVVYSVVKFTGASNETPYLNVIGSRNGATTGTTHYLVDDRVRDIQVEQQYSNALLYGFSKNLLTSDLGVDVIESCYQQKVGTAVMDANPRFQRSIDGKMEWGAGSGAVDTNLYRTAANILKSDDKVVSGAGLGAPANANTNTPSGATAYAMEVFNASGSSLGFIPVYAAEW